MENLNQVAEIELTYKTKVKASERKKIHDSKSCSIIFKGIEAYEKNMELKEVFYTMYLNRFNQVLAVMKISEGGISGTVVEIKHVIKPAIDLNASSIILCHNHPSGNTTPSNADKEITQKIKQAAKLFDITLMDHLIITEESYYSFADEGDI
jgi:DNA repair protein RadC